ncbi:MAG: leucine-rich repeat protein [Firmicutes bacterium]|uniref:Leucine-rich repeat protein n=1 Tax=Candidatus Alloenteromonas pullistercoris TaxID=2840785 RepID=A0A9D9GV25_9FIRM|nr:leucine-rich repeat protein [Candidatus Enteromonas pullistercoris]
MKKEIRLMGICALAAIMLASCAESSSKIEYTISFYDGDTFISSLKTKGNETIELPDAPEKEDAEFKGWYLDEGVWQEQLTEDYFLSHDIDGDLDSFAYYLVKEEPAPEEFTISFFVDGELYSSLLTAGNELLSLPEAPNKDDYEFKGWYFDDGTFENRLYPNTYENLPLEDDVSVYAYYALIEDIPEEYQVSFIVNGGTLIEPIVTSKIEDEPKTSRKGYTFLGWYFDKSFSSKASFPLEITEDITLYAKWEKNTYDVHFELYGGRGVSDLKTDRIETEPLPTKDGYTFLGWYLDSAYSEKASFPFDVTGNITLYAKWEKNTYDVHFELYGGTGVSDLKTDRIETEPIPTKEGYTFLGWYFDESFSSKASFPLEVTGNITLYAKWEENELAGITFTVDGSGLLTAVEGISETNSEVIIPSQVNGQAVKQIGQDLFRDNPYLRKLSIPDGVSLGYRMCSGCASLEEVDLPSGITVIPDYAFEGCASLRSIELPKTLVQIRLEAFSGSGLESLSAPSSLKEIWSYAFKDCRSLAEVDLNEVTSLGDMAFENCALLSSVSLPDSLLELGSYVFSGCSSLYSITMPSRAIAIESTAFYGTGYYNDPSSWDSGVLYVDSYLVATNADFAAVSSYSVKPGTIAIAEKAFANNGKKLESITLPDGLLFIGNGAFSSLSSLKTANIPSSVNRIGYGVFSGTALYKDTANWEGNGLYLDSWLLAVENVKITEFAVKEGTIGAADGNDASLFPNRAKSVATLSLPSTLRYVGSRSFAQLKVTSLSLPESLQSIGEGGFSSCAFLTSANLGDCLSLVSIGDQAFSGASLSQITIPYSVLTMGELVFNQNRVDLSISCLVQSKPEGWEDDWAYSYKEGVSISVNWAA